MNLIFDEELAIVQAENQPTFANEPNYQELINAKNAAIKEWKTLSPQEKKTYNNNIKKYFDSKGVTDIKDPTVTPAKNLYLMNNEVVARLNTQNIFDTLPIDSFYFEKSTLELLENMENVAQIKEL